LITRAALVYIFKALNRNENPDGTTAPSADAKINAQSEQEAPL
jgi:hypothetical protein